MKYSKLSKTERLRKRQFFQYNKQNYPSAARLGEALLRAHALHHSTDTDVYEDDLYNTALACSHADRIDRAIELYSESIHLTFSRSGATLNVAVRLTNLASLLSAYDHHEPACRMFMQALTIRRQILPYNHLDLANALYNMGYALVRANRYRDAIPALNGALHIYSGRKSDGHKRPDNLINCLHTLAKAYENLEEYEKACQYAEAAFSGLTLADAEKYYQAGYYLAQLYEEAGRNTDACELYFLVMGWVERTTGCLHSSYINIGTKAAIVLVKLQDYHKAKELLLRLYGLIDDMAGNDNLTYSNCARNLAVIHRQLEEWDQAVDMIRESIIIKRRIMGGHVREFVSDCLLLLDICVSSDRRDTAKEMLLSAFADIPEDDPAILELLDEMGVISGSISSTAPF